MNISPETDFFEDIKSVGQGGHYLKQKSTRAAVRSAEFYVPEILDKGSYDELGIPGKQGPGRRRPGKGAADPGRGTEKSSSA